MIHYLFFSYGHELRYRMQMFGRYFIGSLFMFFGHPAVSHGYFMDVILSCGHM